MIIIAPSLLSADFTVLSEEIKSIELGGAEYLHLDVMDGAFVPNISFGIPVIKSLRKCSKLVFDTHLMIAEPIRYIDAFIKAGADIITIHAEACKNIEETLSAIRDAGIRPALSIKPKTPIETVYPYLGMVDMILIMSVEPGFGGQEFMPEVLPKISALRGEITARGLKTDIQVDGGITAENVGLVVGAGANIIVAGSSVFGKPDRAAAIAALKKSDN